MNGPLLESLYCGAMVSSAWGPIMLMAGTEIERLRQQIDKAADMAEAWGGAPPNPSGRRAALARAIRALKEAS